MKAKYIKIIYFKDMFFFSSDLIFREEFILPHTVTAKTIYWF